MKKLLLTLPLLCLMACSKKEEPKVVDAKPLPAESRRILQEKLQRKNIKIPPQPTVVKDSKETPPQLIESLRRNLYGLPEKTQQERLKKILEQNPRLQEFKGLESKVLAALKDKKPLAPEKAPVNLIKGLRDRLEKMDENARAKEMERLRKETNLFARYPELEKQITFKKAKPK